MDVRLALLVVGLLVSSAAAAQIHTATGPAPRPTPAAPKAAHNSMSKTTTPFDCQQYRWPSHRHRGQAEALVAHPQKHPHQRTQPRRPANLFYGASPGEE